jgi:hypothetical protein
LHGRVFAGMKNECLVSLVTVMCEEILLCCRYTETEVFYSVSRKYDACIYMNKLLRKTISGCDLKISETTSDTGQKRVFESYFIGSSFNDLGHSE